MQNVLDSMLDQQRQAWLDGGSPSVEELLQGSSLKDDSEAQLDLVYNEIVVREELGEQPTPEEYIQRYPHLKEDLHLHFEVHRAVKDQLLIETAPVDAAETLPELEAPVPASEPLLDDYELLGQLGQGGMGIVYKARHRRLHRLVAVKMFQPGRLPSPREVLRFQTEAEAIARLQHPNIVQIFEIGHCNGLPFLALELAEQGTLAQKLQQLQFKPRAAAELIDTLARAVQHAHEQHIIHRDLKPANVLVTRDGTVKITDFGLAKILHGDEPSRHDTTQTGEPIGTPRYMAPEQAAGQQDRIGPATDVYALGTLLYECLTGQVPFLSKSMVHTLEKIRLDEPQSPRRLQSSIPRDLETICLNCLQKEPTRRYASALALGEDLQRFLHGEPIMARPTPRWERLWKWCRRYPAHAALVAIAVFSVVSFFTVFFLQIHRENKRLAEVRDEVDRLMTAGQEAHFQQNEEVAQARFQAALRKIHPEPALQYYRVGIEGWLNSSRNSAKQPHWGQRTPPREFDDKRDEAVLLSVLLGPREKDAIQAARQAIEAALELTIVGEPAWRHEREQLMLMDADVAYLEAGAESALARLEQTERPSSRQFYERRALYLDQLGRKAEAEGERLRASQIPPNESRDLFLSGVDRLRRREFDAAMHDFETVLNSEPEQFAARLFLAVSCLHLKRPAEAKVALTACMAQRPYFVWSYLLRGQACQQLGDAATARQDLQTGLKMKPSEPARLALLAQLGLASQAVGNAEKAGK